MKLNLGCGSDIQPGYLNIDSRELKGIDLVHDLEKADLPIPDLSVEEVRAIDVLEHFSFRNTERILRDWHRVLQVGGRIHIQVPDLTVHIHYLRNKTIDPRGRYKNGYDDSIEYFRANVFGGQDYPENTHRTCFTMSSMRSLLKIIGFTDISTLSSGRALIVKAKR